MTERNLLHLLKLSGVRPKRLSSRVVSILEPLPVSRGVRVVKVGKNFTCSLCGSSHLSEDAADACLRRCSLRRLSQAKVREWVVGSSVRYSCPHCGRYYTNSSDASECLERCQSTIMLHLPPEILLQKDAVKELSSRSGDILSDSKKPGTSRKLRDFKPSRSMDRAVKSGQPVLASEISQVSAARTVPPHNTKETSKADYFDDDFGSASQNSKVSKEGLFECTTEEGVSQLSALESNTEGEPVFEGAVSNSASDELVKGDNLQASPYFSPGSPLVKKLEDEIALAKESKVPGVKRFRKPNQKPFFRDGAAYVCSVCRAKHFTKKDVESCFYSHPIEETEAS